MSNNVFIFVSLLFTVVSLLSSKVFAQNGELINRQYDVAKVKEKILIDGKLNEESWLTAIPIHELWQHFPNDTLQANKATQIMALVDDNYLYIAAICIDSSRKPIVQSLARDAESAFWLSDAFSVIIDPLNTGRIGYFFGVNAGGGEIDAFLSQSGFLLTSDINWNRKWHSAVQQTPEGQIYELAIPLSIMQIDANNTLWGINFIRNDMEHSNCIYEWTRFKSQFDKRDLTKLGKIKLQRRSKNKSNRLSLIPSTTLKTSRDLVKNTATVFTPKLGLDAKISITPNTSADVMLFPDFSQVNVDKESLSFQDYEQYKTEQRLFFLENSDLFTSYGSSLYKHIYTRRIGIINSTYIPLWAGAKISSSSKNIRWACIDVQSNDYEKQPGQNFAIAALSKQFENKSELRCLLTNIEFFKNGTHQANLANRTLGIEYKFPALNGRLNTAITASKSFSEGNPQNSFHTSISTKFLSPRIRQNNLINIAQSNFINQMGYYPRMFKPDDAHDTLYRWGMTEIHNKLEYWHNTGGNWGLNYLIPYCSHNSYILSNGHLDEQFFSLGMQAVHKNSGVTQLSITYDRELLLYPFEAVKGLKLIPAGQYYGFSGGVNHKTNQRAKVSYETDLQYGSYFVGTKLSIYNAFIIRLQPHVNIKLDYTQAKVYFSDSIGSVRLHLLGLQNDIFINRNHIVTVLYQVNTQKDKMKINARYQWHYSPMSDFYVMFGEDFSSETPKAKSLNFAFKLTYWLSL